MATFDTPTFYRHAASRAWRSPSGHGRVALSPILAVIAALGMNTDTRAETPKATIELFTSQGCSSCPPADKLLGELMRDQSVVAISLPIDIWDYIGWKDTLALKGHTKRQQAYARARGDREVYTPQVVVNGMMQVAGSDRSAIERAIEATRSEGVPMALQLTLNVSGDKLTVEVPASNDAQGQGEVWLLPLTKKIPVAIERGENKGHTITYSNVVRRWVKLGEWSGKAASFNLPLKELQTGDIDSVTVIVQSVANGPKLMLGAAQIALQ